MEPLVRFTALAAPLPEDDVDTDVIFPARFLLIPSRVGLGRYAFHDRARDADGKPRPDFVLNQPAYASARILVAGANFGSGSSREQAVWALKDLGFRAVIAPSFGEIFAANGLKNGMAPVVLPPETVADLMEDARSGRTIMVDIEALEVGRENGENHAFALPASAREALLHGWDEVKIILKEHADEIAAFETRQRGTRPWLYAGP